jgi:endonuclease III
MKTMQLMPIALSPPVTPSPLRIKVPPEYAGKSFDEILFLLPNCTDNYDVMVERIVDANDESLDSIVTKSINETMNVVVDMVVSPTKEDGQVKEDGKGKHSVDVELVPKANTNNTSKIGVMNKAQLAALYHEIMSPSFPIGARVFIKYGVARGERWFPGSVIDGSRNGGYKVVYDDGDVMDASILAKPHSHIILMTSDNDELSCISSYGGGSDNEEEFVDESDEGGRAKKKKKTTPAPKNSTSHEEFACRLKRKQTVEVFPPRQRKNGKSLPRLKTGTAVVKADSKTGSNFVGIVRQILRDPSDGSFRYIIRSPPSVHPLFHEEVKEMKFVAEARLGRRWATKKPFVSQSSSTKDVFLSPTKSQVRKDFAPTVARYLLPGQNRDSALASFRLRYASKSFRANQSRVLEGLEAVVNKYIETLPSEVSSSLRGDWKNWGVVDTRGDNYVFQLVALLVHTNASRDFQLHCSMQEVFLHGSLVTGTCFKDPYTFARDPQAGYNFLTARAAMFAKQIEKPISDNHKDEDDEGEEVVRGISKGFNYCNVKAKHLVFLSKQLVVAKYTSLTGHDCKGKAWFHVESMLPVPASIVELVQEAAARAGEGSLFLFPKRYDATFLDSLMGIGPKIRNLVAEAGYNVAGGPAVDCHMIRYVVSFGSGSSLLVSSTEALTKDLSRCYPPNLWRTLNEVPATISQIIWSPKCLHLRFISNLKGVAAKFGYSDELAAFLSHYAELDEDTDTDTDTDTENQEIN